MLGGNSDRVLDFPLLFVGLLIAMRLVPAVLRQIHSFSPEATKIWSQRRQIAKRYDSYQWQKLFWIGLGLSSHAFIGEGLKAGEIVVTAFCLLSGGAGLLLWRRIEAVQLQT